MVIGFIASVFLSCSEKKEVKNNEQPEVILEEKISEKATEKETRDLQNAITNLKSLNEEQIEYLNTKATDETEVIEEEKTKEEEIIKESLEELNSLNQEQKKSKKLEL